MAFILQALSHSSHASKMAAARIVKRPVAGSQGCYGCHSLTGSTQGTLRGDVESTLRGQGAGNLTENGQKAGAI
jgi:hypothetical protein